MSRLNRTPQLRGEFTPGDPLSGYYNDLRPEIRAASPQEALVRLDRLWGVEEVNFTTIAQLGIGAWQRRDEDAGWLAVTTTAGRRLAAQLDAGGRLVIPWPMRHTYHLDPPWLSALTQGEATSLFVRAAAVEGGHDLWDSAVRAVEPLIAPSPLVADTAEGPVLQEYPTDPPSHVLNGWIYGLWGLYDLAMASRSTGRKDPDAERAWAAFELGAETLAARVHLYDAWGWSRYDLYPHPIVNVASPYYHRLHIELLHAMDAIFPDERLAAAAARWERSLASRPRRAVAVARKVAFRLVRPRHRRVGSKGAYR